MSQLSFMSEPIKPQLLDGKYTATLESIEEKTGDTGTPYVQFVYALKEHNDRTIKDQRGEKPARIMMSSLRQQLGRQFEEIIPQDFCDELIKNKTQFNIWLLKETRDGKTYNNIYFYDKASIVAAKEATTTGATGGPELPFRV